MFTIVSITQFYMLIFFITLGLLTIFVNTWFYNLFKSSLSTTSLQILKLCSPRTAFLNECFERDLSLSALDLRADSIKLVLLASRTFAKFTLDFEHPIPPNLSTDLYISSKLDKKAQLELEHIMPVEVHEFNMEFRMPGELRSRINLLLGVCTLLINYAP